MDAAPALCDIVEMLQGTKSFHDEAANSSTGDLHIQHEEKSLQYAAMLTEIGRWEDGRRQQNPPQPSRAGTTESDHADADASFSALIRRIYSLPRASYLARAS